MNGDNNKRGLDMFQFQIDGNVVVSQFLKILWGFYMSPP
jgi:hypothetical protein